MKNPEQPLNIGPKGYINCSPENCGSPEKFQSVVLIWRFVNGLMTIFFLLSAIVQINDDNPWIWVTIYMTPAILCSMITYWNSKLLESWQWYWLSTVDLVLTTIIAFYKLAEVIQLVNQYISGWHNPLVHKEGRELAGLSIIIFWIITIKFMQTKRLNESTRNFAPVLVLVIAMALTPLIAWAVCFVEELGKDVGHCQDMFPGILGSEFKDKHKSDIGSL